MILRCLAKSPDARFPTASALTAALAVALNTPVPPEVAQSIYSMQSTVSAPLPEPTNSEAPTIRSSAESAQAPSAGVLPPSLPDTLPPSSPPLTPAPPPAKPFSAPRGRYSGLRIGLVALLILIVIGAGLGAFFALRPGTTSAQFKGQAYFLSSGHVDLTQLNSPGIDDELVIEIQNMPAPGAGKSYYAWLGKDVEGEFILLGKLPFNNGQVNFLYPGDGQHTNLLAIASHLLITEENSAVRPTNPSPTMQVYRADFPTTPDPADPNHFSLLDHYRHLLSGEPELDRLGVHGGLNIWLRNDTAQVFAWAETAKDHWNGPNTNPSVLGYIRGQVLHILDVLDGIGAVQQDLPTGTGPDQRDANVAQIALIDTPGQTPPDYVNHIIFHLNSIAQFPGASSGTRQLVNQIINAVNAVHSSLETVRNDAKQLVQLGDQQLAQTSSLALLNEMATAAEHAYAGQIDPVTGQMQHEGVLQIYSDIQQLVSFQLSPV